MLLGLGLVTFTLLLGQYQCSVQLDRIMFRFRVGVGVRVWFICFTLLPGQYQCSVQLDRDALGFQLSYFSSPVLH